ncbi:hypothetical protein Z969_07695 [Clostridium novyi A str. 4570]|uniref:Uncharacterized protein n=1 Tax=Clostridium novyi A str. 4570 TaxID=1444290 RepID=A0AA88ZN95_CLONO|nr:hypothetical protein [Clostridium novyi]KGN01813.1 hypothetical protein Z969_07695 [Clostridium novyi A str. 4570]
MIKRKISIIVVIMIISLQLIGCNNKKINSDLGINHSNKIEKSSDMNRDKLNQDKSENIKEDNKKYKQKNKETIVKKNVDSNNTSNNNKNNNQNNNKGNISDNNKSNIVNNNSINKNNNKLNIDSVKYDPIFTFMTIKCNNINLVKSLNIYLDGKEFKYNTKKDMLKKEENKLLL